MTGILQAILAGYGGAGATFTVIQTFTASGTWTCPTGVTEVEYLSLLVGVVVAQVEVAVVVQVVSAQEQV
jgi:hypothetical protein